MAMPAGVRCPPKASLNCLYSSQFCLLCRHLRPGESGGGRLVPVRERPMAVPRSRHPALRYGERGTENGERNRQRPPPPRRHLLYRRMNWPPVDLPAWLPWFLIGGVGIVLVGVPLKVMYDATRSGRDRGRKIDSFIDRLRERFAEVAAVRLPFRPIRVTFKHEGRRFVMLISDL